MGTRSMKTPKIGHGDDEGSTAMEVISANEDILIEILLFLPPKSLLRFRSVSKAWLSIISSSRFRLLKSKRFRKEIISGLFLRHLLPEYDFFPLDCGGRNPPFERLDFVDGESGGLVVLQSCNGLLLCRSYPDLVLQNRYYVINPTTKEYSLISRNVTGNLSTLWKVNLAFDPRKSIHFKLICVYYTRDVSGTRYDLRIYSSETGLMTKISHPFNHEKVFLEGVYWNDAINWIHNRDDGLYFNIDEERFGILPMPPLPQVEGREEWEGRWLRYYGESNDHLHLVFIESSPASQFYVYEMDRGYSGWSRRFFVDLQPVFRSFPGSVRAESSAHWYNVYRYSFEIVGIVEKDDENESFLVLIITGNAIRINLKDKSFTKMCDDSTTRGGLRPSSGLRGDSFKFIESLHPIRM